MEFDLKAILTFIEENETLAYDTETTGLNVRKDLVMGFSISNADTGFYIPVRQYDITNDTVVLSHVNSNDISCILKALTLKKLLMFNASFDARITLNNLGVDLLPALHTDVLLLKHTCDEDFPFGLKEIATKLWGHDVKKEKEEMQASIKLSGGTVHQYYKADPALLAKYCISDCLLTFRLYNHYSLELQKQGLNKFYYEDEVLPLYKEVTIPMENAGVRLDMVKLESDLHSISADLSALNAKIQEAVHPHLTSFYDWFADKEYPFKATGRVGKLLKKKPHLTLKDVQLRLMDQDYPEGAFNLLSKHHLKKLFFDELKCKPLSTTPTGLPQVDEEFMQSVQKDLPWVTDLIIYNKLTKLKGTYIERLISESEDGRFYPSFMQHRTVSGRYAGDLQQLPRPIPEDGSLVSKYTNRIREYILPDSDCTLVSADYETLEPSIFAHTSGDPALQAIFNSGTDFYSEVAIRTEGIKGVSSLKSDANYLGTIDKSRRQRAKSYALGIAYGMTGYKLQFEIGVSNEEADRLVDQYLAAFPKLAQWMAKSKDDVKRTGRIATQSGRIRHMPRASALFEQYGPIIDDDLRLWKAFNGNSQKYALAKLDRREYKNLLNNSINFQVQGLAASIVNRAAIAISRELNKSFFKSRIVMQVHDELVLNVPNKELAAVSHWVQTVMQNIVPLSVPLKTTPQSGTNFKECK